MKIKEKLYQEDMNRNKLILYKEGIFFKAYDRSAYAFHTRIKPFQLKLKTIDIPKDRDIFPKGYITEAYITLGFPIAQQEKYIGNLLIVEDTPELLIVELTEDINEEDYNAWFSQQKAELEQKTKQAKEKSAASTNPLTETKESPSEEESHEELLPVWKDRIENFAQIVEALNKKNKPNAIRELPQNCDWNDWQMRYFCRLVKKLNLADITPIEALNFLYLLQQDLRELKI